MRTIVLTMLCYFMLATTATANLLSADAEQVSARFVRQIEVGDFEQAYDQASPLLRLTNERHQWITMMERSQSMYHVKTHSKDSYCFYSDDISHEHKNTKFPLSGAGQDFW